jgi:hypothetical protein
VTAEPEDRDVVDSDVAFGDLSQREIVAMLKPYDDAREWAKRQKGIGEVIRGWLEAHPEEMAVRDGEAGLEASLQWRSTGDVYDVVAMPDGLVLALAGHGCLKVDPKAVETLSHTIAAAARAKQYKRPGGTAPALVVRRLRS